MTANLDYRSPLHQMALTMPTEYWNDSCAISELTYAIEHGAVGATSNPTIVHAVIKQEMHLWRERILAIIADHPTFSETEIAWQVFEEAGVKGAELLLPIFEREQGKKGRLSIQTNPTYYRSADAILAQTLELNRLAPNMQVKIPATGAGISAIEEATYQGVNINATVSFTVAQAVAVAEAVERGLRRLDSAGHDTSRMTPVCTIMVGRVDDWMSVVANRDNITVQPGSAAWAGVAVMKKAYQIFRERGYRTRLLSAAYRHVLHWSEFLGGDVILSMPALWQKRFNASDVAITPRMDNPVDPAIIADLYTHLADFRKAYDEDGLSLAEFDTYGATVRTLRGFIASYHDLIGLIREEFMLPNPDIAREKKA